LNKNKIYILQLGMTKNIGGMETYLMSQYRKLDKKYIQYDFVNLSKDDKMAFSEEIKNNGSKIYSVPKRKYHPFLHYYEMMKILFHNRKKYKYIVLNTCHLYYIFPLFFAKIIQIPNRIIHSHNSDDEIKISFFRKILININKILMHFSVTDYWACSEIAGKWMFKNRNFRVIHNAINVSDFVYNESIRQKVRTQLGLLKDEFVIGHVGRFSYQKNHDFLIDVFNEVHRRLPEAVLILIGDAVEDELYLNKAKQKVKELNLVENVRFLGIRNDVPDLMQAMDCFLFPSRFEGLGIVIIEAQTAGLPCYVSSVIPNEVKITNLVDFISLNESPENWAEKIIKNKNYKRKDASKEIIKAGYDINTEIKKMQKFYEREDI
jgi:glycosyltransferase involved in cell wall biosynthesis